MGAPTGALNSAGVVTLAAALAAVAVWGATRAARVPPVRSCAAEHRPKKTAEKLQLASSHIRWLAGAPSHSAAHLWPSLRQPLALAAMKRKYELSDIGKALRVCIMYAASLEASTQAALLSPVHAAKDDVSRGCEEADFQLRGAQRDWLRDATKRCAP